MKISSMEAIYIPKLLKKRDRQEKIAVNDSISRLTTLTPVKGWLKVRHGGNFLEVLSQVETIVTLTCDRCLQNYNHRLSVNISELIWLEAESEKSEQLPSEREVSVEDLSETLPPDGYFDPENWLYEQLSLALPMRQICSQDCQVSVTTTSTSEIDRVDSRWASLASLKEQLGE
jgi:uncharacterized protein